MPASTRRVSRLVPVALAALLVACAAPSAPAAPSGASGGAGAAPAAPPQRVRAAYVAIGGQAEQFAALQNGALDGAILTPPTNLLAVRLGYRELLNYREYSLDFANVGLVTTRRYLREQPDAVDRMLRASAEAVAIM